MKHALSKRLTEMIAQYKRFGKIDIQVLEANEREIIVSAKQFELVNDKVLTDKELIERTKDLFKDEIPSSVKVHVRPLIYKKDE